MFVIEYEELSFISVANILVQSTNTVSSRRFRKSSEDN